MMLVMYRSADPWSKEETWPGARGWKDHGARGVFVKGKTWTTGSLGASAVRLRFVGVFAQLVGANARS